MWQLQAVIIALAAAPMATNVFTFTKLHQIFFFAGEKRKDLELKEGKGICEANV